MSELTGTCQTCGTLVTAADGALWIDRNEVASHRAQVSEWEVVDDRQPIRLADAAAVPCRVAWQVTHRRCMPESANACEFPLPADNEQLMRTVAHIESKSWARYTGTTDLLQEAADRTGRFAPGPDPWRA